MNGCKTCKITVNLPLSEDPFLDSKVIKLLKSKYNLSVRSDLNSTLKDSQSYVVDRLEVT